MSTNAEKTQTQYIDYATTATAITQRRQGEIVSEHPKAATTERLKTGHVR